MLPIEALQERIEKSELGQEWSDNPLLNQDVWSVEELGYSEEESTIKGTRNIYFEEFSLPWLKLLAKLTALAIAREKRTLGTTGSRVNALQQFDKFLITEGYSQPELLTDSLLQKFITNGSKRVIRNRQLTIAYITRLWAEEQWLRLPYRPRKYQKETPKIEVVPEEVLHQIYENFNLFPPPLERLFRLQLVLGCRIGEMLKCKCHFCGIRFNPDSRETQSWVGRQIDDKLLPFSFNEDTWNLGHFYDKPDTKTVNFQTVNPYWYRQQVKKYLHYLLKSKVFNSTRSITQTVSSLRQFGKIIIKFNLKNKSEINRNTVIQFLDSCKNIKSSTFNIKLQKLRDFLDWLDLETPSLIRGRDFLKTNKNDPDWLDEVTRQAIKQHLYKIPAPIARNYLVQAYIAARPGDVCQLSFDCLIEDNGKWYIKFLQQKVKRWHRILASRKIRKVIEEQQQWIREVFVENYSYLFCHFRTIKQASYPTFPHIKPLPQPPISAPQLNPMVRIIRMLIENENILDANGKKPHFTGRITRHSRLQEVRAKYGMEAARLYADHKSSTTTFQHYAPPTREQIAKVDLPFQELLMNPDNKFIPWQSLPETLLKNPKAHELDLEIAPRLVVYGHCTLNPKTPCPINLFPKCYGCSSFRPSTGKLPLYERQYQGEQQRLTEAEKVGAELASEEAKATIEAMDKWLPELRRLANGEA